MWADINPIVNQISAHMPIMNRINADWHRADIIAALRKRGLSLRQLSAREGYRTNAVQLALKRPAPVYEQIIADELGLHPKDIWPSRYDENGTSRHRVMARRVFPVSSTAGSGGHDRNTEAA